MAEKSEIQGVVVRSLRQVFDERGKVMTMLRCDDKHFESFGEIYFSSTFPGVVKAWHLHRDMTLNYAVVQGFVKLVLYDGRSDSPTYEAIKEIILSPENYNLVTVPPNVWNGFKCIGREPAILANCSSLPHDPDEIVRLAPNTSTIPYNWNLEHR